MRYAQKMAHRAKEYFTYLLANHIMKEHDTLDELLKLWRKQRTVSKTIYSLAQELQHSLLDDALLCFGKLGIALQKQTLFFVDGQAVPLFGKKLADCDA